MQLFGDCTLVTDGNHDHEGFVILCLNEMPNVPMHEITDTHVAPFVLGSDIEELVHRLSQGGPLGSVCSNCKCLLYSPLRTSDDKITSAATSICRAPRPHSSSSYCAAHLHEPTTSGVLSYLVAQRTSGIGLRIALGARREQQLRLILMDGLRPAFIGLALGLAAVPESHN